MKWLRYAAADIAQAIADACRAWVAREDERAADACNGPGTGAVVPGPPEDAT